MYEYLQQFGFDPRSAGQLAGYHVAAGRGRWGAH